MAAVGVAAGCGVAVPAADAVAGGPAAAYWAGPVGAPIAWAPCGPEGLECARVRVPLDWDRPNGRTIGLAVIRHLASKTEQRIGSLFVNPGGPGESGVAFVTNGGAELDGYGDGRFDVVGWDPRGTNASSPVRCFRNERSEARFWKGASIPTTRAASRRFRRKTAALARRCGEVSGGLLRHTSTADAARDLDHLRSLVGDEALTYAGFSHGTYLGQTYANMFGDRVRAMVLDGIVDPVAYSRGAEARVGKGAHSCAHSERNRANRAHLTGLEQAKSNPGVVARQGWRCAGWRLRWDSSKDYAAARRGSCSRQSTLSSPGSRAISSSLQ